MDKGRGVLRATVRNDFVKKSKAEEDFVEEQGSDPFSGDGFLHRAKNHPLSKSMVLKFDYMDSLITLLL